MEFLGLAPALITGIMSRKITDVGRVARHASRIGLSPPSPGEGGTWDPTLPTPAWNLRRVRARAHLISSHRIASHRALASRARSSHPARALIKHAGSRTNTGRTRAPRRCVRILRAFGTWGAGSVQGAQAVPRDRAFDLARRSAPLHAGTPVGRRADGRPVLPRGARERAHAHAHARADARARAHRCGFRRTSRTMPISARTRRT